MLAREFIYQITPLNIFKCKMSQNPGCAWNITPLKTHIDLHVYIWFSNHDQPRTKI